MADLLSSISVLLVFLTFLFNSIEKDVTEKINQRKPEPAQTMKLRQYYNELWKLIFLRTLPVTLIFIVIFYSLLPRTIHIIITSEVAFWQFDELKTIFVFIEFGLLGLSIYATKQTIQLLKKARE